MLIFQNLFFKSFWKRKHKFKSYFVLILIFIISLLFLFQINKKIDCTINELNNNIEFKKIVVTNLDDRLDKSYFNSINGILKVNHIFEPLNVSTNFGKIQISSFIESENEKLIIEGRGLDDDSLEIVLPNYLYIDNNFIDLTNYYDTFINISYINKNGIEEKTNVKVVGIYDNSNGYNFVFGSEFFFESLDVDSTLSNYIVVTNKISDIDKVLDALDNDSNSYIYDISSYESNRNILLVSNILKFISFFITLMMCLLFFILSNNLIYDLKNDIAILRAYGYSNLYIIKNISILLIFIYFICYIVSIILITIGININVSNAFFNLITIYDYFKVLLIGIINIMVSLLISIIRLKNKTITYLLREN